MSAVGSAIGGGVAGGAIGYAVAGRTGAVVGCGIGLVGGYNVEPLAEWYSGAVAAERAPRVATFRADRAVAGDRGAGDSAVGVAPTIGSPTASTVDERTAKQRLIEAWYNPNATIVPSRNGDPWGSFRVKRDPEWELPRLNMFYGSAVGRVLEGTWRGLFAGVTLGLSELLIQTVAASRRDALNRSIQERPEWLLLSPDYPPALYIPEKGDDGMTGVSTRDYVRLSDAEQKRQIELYGPTIQDVEAAWRRGDYVANLLGRKSIGNFSTLTTDSVVSYKVQRLPVIYGQFNG